MVTSASSSESPLVRFPPSFSSPELPDSMFDRESSSLVQASPLLMRLWTARLESPEVLEDRAQGAERLKELCSSDPFHAKRAAKRPDYWNELYSAGPRHSPALTGTFYSRAAPTGEDIDLATPGLIRGTVTDAMVGGGEAPLQRGARHLCRAGRRARARADRQRIEGAGYQAQAGVPRA